MLLVKFVPLLFVYLVEAKLLPYNIRFDGLANFVKNVIQELNVQDPTTPDVVLLQLGKSKDMKTVVDEVYELLLAAIPEDNCVFIPNMTVTSDAKHVKKNVITIIVSDVFDRVSN